MSGDHVHLVLLPCYGPMKDLGSWKMRILSECIWVGQIFDFSFKRSSDNEAVGPLKHRVGASRFRQLC